MHVPTPAELRFLQVASELRWDRVKAHRAEPLLPGGRCRLTLFESVDGGRPHPRLRVSLPPALDPSPPGVLFRPDTPFADAASLEEAVRATLETRRAVLDGRELDVTTVPASSRRFFRASIRGQRHHALFAQVEAALEARSTAWPEEERDGARYQLALLRDEVLVGAHVFDDEDTGTYHSYGKDEPFVHVLQAILDTVPAPGSDAFEVLPVEQQAAVRAQRRQCQAHLDHLMRHKYAFHGIDEGDIERSLGGRLIHRRHREVVTSTREEGSLTATLTLLRVEPDAEHPRAGRFVYRDGDALRLKDGTEVQVSDELLREIPVKAREVTFERHPDGPLLREGVPFDWSGDGLLAPEPIGWVDWAGHCDLKAIQEAIGLTLTDAPPPVVHEFRTDTGEEHTFTRDQLLEILTAIMELGSVYDTFDGSQSIVRGVTHFGGARNDSLPDRLQFQGLSQGNHFRWPLDRREDALVLEALSGHDGPTDALFQRWFADGEALTLTRNARYLKTVEGDYAVIEVSGQELVFSARDHGFDEETGEHRRQAVRRTLDLGRTAGRSLLGVHLHDPAARETYRVWLDHAQPAIIAELERWERTEAGWSPRTLADGRRVVPLVHPVRVTLSREMGIDEPSSFQALLDAALRRGEGIVADTDAESAVWNGVVTRLDVDREALDPVSRTERWRVDIKARFGRARLRWLLRRKADGSPEAWAALPNEDDVDTPDFLWQDYPDVASKGLERGTWVVNRTMVDRGIVELRDDETVEGGVYVHDEHVKNLAEILWCGLSGHAFTIVHNNKRYAFQDEASWTEAIEEVSRRRAAL